MMRVLFLLLCFSFCSVSVQSQSTDKPAFMGIFVNNLDSMKNWYVEKLNFKVLEHKIVSDKIGFAMLEGHGLWLELIYNANMVTRNTFTKTFPQAPGMEGFFKLGLFTTELEKLEKELKAKKVLFKYPLMNNENFSMKLFIVEDPEGNLLQFYYTPKQSF